MEEQIKHIAKSQRIVYVIFWAVAILLVVGGETELLPVGLFADDVRTSYYLETIGILLFRWLSVVMQCGVTYVWDCLLS